ncbi:carbohydrate binding family 9 domain-containing protein [Thalassotalea litorea]|uniref:carbohydrate binding family 9 domain-containing protein n=1 Tax=Thalassotalea litorea TaxID=2020715 RepID=UPI0037356739
MILLRENVKGLLLCVGLFLVSFASVSKQQFSIPHIKADVTLDGELNEAAWQQAQRVDLDIVNHPYNNTPSPVKTQVYIFEDGEKINFAFKAFDPNPKNIQAFLRDRDQAWGDDLVGIKLDTFNDHRLAYKFFVNPFGVQNDGIQNEMTGEDSNLWDGIWYSFGKITDFGYLVEFSIPYRELNFQPGDDIKTWGIEMMRLYPRNQRLRISHIKIDRDNQCWVCQMDELTGFENAKTGQNLTITPSLVALHNKEKADYLYPDDQSQTKDWQSENDIEPGLNVRWGITPDTLLNVTLNPDFSNVETDAGQLSVNQNEALYFDEKRPFFLDNSEYFSSQSDLVYTRNIVDPDLGVKLTGRESGHSFGLFTAKDQQTNFILPGNVYSRPVEVAGDNWSSALRYRYDVNNDLSLGLISTIRQGDQYHNLVSGVDGKYKITDSNKVVAQVMYSDTEYPDDLFNQFCMEGQCGHASLVGKQDERFSDTGFKIGVEHNSTNWSLSAHYQDLGQDFRADLGYMPLIDIKQLKTNIERIVYSDDSWWTDLYFGAEYESTNNQENELINESFAANFSIFGPMQSFAMISLIEENRVGLRFNPNDTSIDGNTTLFDLSKMNGVFLIQPLPNFVFQLYAEVGDGIDYYNDRVGDAIVFAPEATWNINQNTQLDMAYTFAKLDAEGANVYIERVSDMRLSYQFDINSSIKLNLVYTDSDINLSNDAWAYDFANYDFDDNIAEKNNVSAQLIYSYRINPQTVFFLGYSSNGYKAIGQPNTPDQFLLKRLAKTENETAFLKLSYAWM